MSHGHHAAFDPTTGMIVLVVVLLFLPVVLWFFFSKTVGVQGLTSWERKNLPFHERELVSMLRQHGGPMRQDLLVESLAGDSEYLFDFILELEKKGLIKRAWDAGTSTFLIQAPIRE